MRKLISVIIPNYNGEKFLCDCLESLLNQSYGNFEVIIVDNNSSDQSMNIIDEIFFKCSNKYIFDQKKLSIIRNTENLGFSKAVNQGILASKGSFVFLLNNDVILEEKCLANLLNNISEDDNLFSVQAKMIQSKNRDLIDDAGDQYTILGWAYKRGDGSKNTNYTKNSEIFSSCAGAALYRKNLLDKIGYFDENFFAYMEDVDLSYRAKIFGFKNMYCASAIVYHIGSATTGSKYNEFKVRLAAKNNILVPYKNMPLLQLLCNLPFLIIGFLIKYLFFFSNGYGKQFCTGTFEGINALRNVKKVEFKKNNMINYIRIEYELIMNTIRYFFLKLKFKR
ncbi:MAG: glycosyltransferase family 2 protein [Bacillota bacterium]|nr:glycosyltransferase family 2 protein [Bacillota bacterium]